MECEKCRRMISRELDGAAAAFEKAEVERHIASCNSCASFLRTSRAAFAVHRSFAEVAPPISLLPSILAAVEARPKAGFIPGRLRFAMSAAAIAAAVLGFWIGGMVHESYVPKSTASAEDILGLDYLDEYPPGSFGNILMASNRGGEDE